MTTILDALQKGTGYLEKQGVEHARLNMQHLLAYVAGCDRMQLYVNFDQVIEESKLEKLRQLMRDRAAGHPLQHLLGTVDFHGHEFICDERGLIPRPETETLVERLAKMTWPAGARILDMGCGSGVIGLSLAAALRAQSPKVVLADISPEALALTKENADKLAVALEGADVVMIQSDLFSGVEGKFDLIVANLPYVSEGDMQTLSREVKHDPELALRGGPQGTELMERFLSGVSSHLQPGGLAALEYGFGQGPRLQQVAQSFGFATAELLKDDEGKERYLYLRTN